MKITRQLTPLAVAIAIAVFMVGCSTTENDISSPEEQDKLGDSVIGKLVQERHVAEEKQKTENRARDTTGLRAAPQPSALPQSVTSAPPGKYLLGKHEILEGGGLTTYGQSADLSPLRAVSEPLDRENYHHFDDNPVKRTAEQPVSTFSIDVDTGAYANVRRFLNQGRLPREDAVRVEELVNYFSYDYPQPQGKHPFSVTTELSPTPWNKNTLLLHVGIQGKDVAKQTLPPANLVFLVDVSGSMQSADKLELLKNSMTLLSKQLRPQDRVSIVVYAGASGVVLPPTAGDQHASIQLALQQLTAGGSTNGAAGIKLAYLMAEQGFIKNGINRVILATDGDFNVGTVNFDALIELVEEKRKNGVSLTTLGFGMGNYNDQLMEQLADAGNGNYAYIDTLNEAQKVLVDEMSATLNTIAKDVKIQIEFNPAQVAEYRLIGYENRVLKREDFNNDKVDAGEIGAGHSVTALYEISLLGSKGNSTDPLRYGKTSLRQKSAKNHELAFLRLRYKQADGDKSTLLEQAIERSQVQTHLARTSDRFRFSAAVAAFGQQLRGADYLKDYGYAEILEMAQNARGKDPFGYRGEFLRLVNMAQSLSGSQAGQNRK